MEWGVKSLIWDVLSNGVCRDIKGVLIELLIEKLGLRVNVYFPVCVFLMGCIKK